jgi:flagellar biosynthesis/type III secretory pathway ATPase
MENNMHPTETLVKERLLSYYKNLQDLIELGEYQTAYQVCIAQDAEELHAVLVLGQTMGFENIKETPNGTEV